MLLLSSNQVGKPLCSSYVSDGCLYTCRDVVHTGNDGFGIFLVTAQPNFCLEFELELNFEAKLHRSPEPNVWKAKKRTHFFCADFAVDFWVCLFFVFVC